MTGFHGECRRYPDAVQATDQPTLAQAAHVPGDGGGTDAQVSGQRAVVLRILGDSDVGPDRAGGDGQFGVLMTARMSSALTSSFGRLIRPPWGSVPGTSMRVRRSSGAASAGSGFSWGFKTGRTWAANSWRAPRMSPSVA